MSEIILSLDLGTKTGWALKMNKDEYIYSGTWNFTPRRFEGGGMRYLRFKDKLKEVLKHSTCIDRIYFEEVRRHLGVDAAHAYGGFLAILTSFCEKNNIPYQGIPVGTIKKHATGKGNSNKALMIDAAKKLYPDNDIKDDNQADALCILNLVIKTIVEN